VRCHCDRGWRCYPFGDSLEISDDRIPGCSIAVLPFVESPLSFGSRPGIAPPVLAAPKNLLHQNHLTSRRHLSNVVQSLGRGRSLQSSDQLCLRAPNCSSTVLASTCGMLCGMTSAALQNPCSALLNTCSSLQNPCSALLNPCSSLQNPRSSLQNPCSVSLNPCSVLLNPCSALLFGRLRLLDESPSQTRDSAVVRRLSCANGYLPTIAKLPQSRNGSIRFLDSIAYK
jgi:hypothetical protein